MSKVKPLSPFMLQALALCKQHGGLWRWRGGFWLPTPPPDQATTPRNGEVWFQTHTIKALRDRGKVEEVRSLAVNYCVQVRATDSDGTNLQ